MKMTISEEMKSDIYEILEDFIENYYSNLRDRMDGIKDELNDFYSTAKVLRDRMGEIEKMIHAHAIGVQNVYNEVQEVKNKLNIPLLNEKILKIEEIRNAI